ncbi:DUF6452 family protein [Muricauda sp. SCSIO 64092]|uniref:DUF6452 family protein n=1 Tax=Allomuricauda sp. SCSIO 64092 TaxID=2908842 RepID=UPI001FF40876|nr:DUF6452 family protein [Muricauda sp. SCSIO 64092]UOY05917.1 DUF6452 family protein [Muricauda sp. SCSIO 64092]
MNRFFPVLLLLLLITHFASCEKDDICVEGDTPLLVIGFYDVLDTLEFKSVPTLRIKAIDNDSILSDSEAYGFGDRANSPDSIFVPLRIMEPTTQFELISGSSSTEDIDETGNRDTLTFTYTVNEEFISRACGFIANFDELDTIRQVSAEDWIKRISISEKNVERSNAIHVKIFH